MEKKAKKKSASRKTFNRLAIAVAQYVKECGGNAVVVGGVRIAAHEKSRHHIEIDFTGSFPLPKSK